MSSSGATVFLEPRELVELNNAIKVADREIDREVQRILRELSGLIAEKANVIVAGIIALGELDRIAARASFGRQLRAHPVLLNEQGRVRLKQARHPLLVLSKERVVANDIVLDDHIQVLVISGPNTGGKTVTLKIVGLFALMARAGMLLPCEPESEMAIFPDLFADIGDAQDLARDLSSFSAHMTQMIQLLNDTHGTRHALILLDEPVTSTDPTEGAALAEALLCRLAALGMKVDCDDALPVAEGLGPNDSRDSPMPASNLTSRRSRRPIGCSWVCRGGLPRSRSRGALGWIRVFSTMPD